MQLRQTKDHLPIRFSYYLTRLHGLTRIGRKILWRVKGENCLLFFNVNLIDNHRMCNSCTLKNEDGLSFVKQKTDAEENRSRI